MYKKLFFLLLVGLSLQAMQEESKESTSRCLELLKKYMPKSENNSQVVPSDVENPSIDTGITQENESSSCFNPFEESEKSDKCWDVVGCVGTCGCLSVLCTYIVWYCVQQSVFG